MNAASIPHRRAALRPAGVPGADVRLQLATVLRYEDIYTDEPMHYDAHIRLASLLPHRSTISNGRVPVHAQGRAHWMAEHRAGRQVGR